MLLPHLLLKKKKKLFHLISSKLKVRKNCFKDESKEKKKSNTPLEFHCVTFRVSFTCT